MSLGNILTPYFYILFVRAFVFFFNNLCCIILFHKFLFSKVTLIIFISKLYLRIFLFVAYDTSELGIHAYHDHCYYVILILINHQKLQKKNT